MATVLSTPSAATPRVPAWLPAPWLAAKKTRVASACMRPKGAPSVRIDRASLRSALRKARRMCSTLLGPCTNAITVRQPAAWENAVASAVPVTPQCSPKIASVASPTFSRLLDNMMSSPSMGRPCTRRMLPMDTSAMRKMCPTATMRVKGMAMGRSRGTHPQASKSGLVNAQTTSASTTPLMSARRKP